MTIILRYLHLESFPRGYLGIAQVATCNNQTANCQKQLVLGKFKTIAKKHTHDLWFVMQLGFVYKQKNPFI